jgi:hypothetical protein
VERLWVSIKFIYFYISMMKQICLTLLLLINCFVITAQIADNFTDGNFNQNPTWIGDDSIFQITSGQLRVRGSVASDAHLATHHNQTDSVTWQFFTRFALSPSTQNFSRFYVLSDTSNLEGPLNGYYVQLGGVTGNTDSITFYRQTGNIRTRLIAGRPGTVSKTNNMVRIKVFRDDLGNWQLFSDTLGGTNFILEGSAFDNIHTNCKYLGWWMRYTAGNSQNFYLDDVRASEPIYDTIPPKVDSITVQGNNNILVYFNEAVDTTLVTQPNNYVLQPANSNPLQIQRINARVVQLTFAQVFISKQNYVLNVSGVKDLEGNNMTLSSHPFLFYVPQVHDVLISEFFPDPSPTILLPEQEFIELYNNSGVAVNLRGFTLSDGSSTAILPNYILGVDSFVIVCATANVPLFNVYGNTIGVSNYPSLNNSSDNIILKDNTTQTIHELSYNLSWYEDAIKDDGGWTIELKSPKQLCKGKQNYTSSVAVNGGTPGTINSVWNNLPDILPPSINTFTVVDDKTIRIHFTEALDTTSVGLIGVGFSPNININNTQVLGLDTLLINTQNAFTNKTQYTVTIANIMDCSSNDTALQFVFNYVVPDTAQNYDVLITEIMADPDPVKGLPNAEYLELHNRSNKIINLKDWILADGSGRARLPDYLLLPDSFITITSSTHALPFDVNVLRVSSFPSLGNDADALTLFNNLGQVIHHVNYTSAWFTDALERNGGWSLEMVDVKNPCDLNNWKVSSNSLGGTPSKQNSVKGFNRDNQPPNLIRVYARDEKRVELFFDEAMDSASFLNTRFVVNNLFSPSSVIGVAPLYNSTIVQFTNALLRDEVYQLVIDSVKDCAGNIIQDFKSIDFGLPYLADSNQLFINEVLFNPRSGGVDFVELYNNSNKLIDVKDLILAKRDGDGNIDQIENIAPAGFTIKPNTHVVISSSPETVQQQYYCMYLEQMIKANTPSMNDDAGNIVLMNTQGVVLDELVYDDKMHVPLLDDKDGVSLERIDLQRQSNERSNWTSAASSVGYGTPTYKNSQYLKTERAESVMELQPKTISPDGDGYEDVMNINYLLNENGYTGTLTIFDAAGKAIKLLFKNNILGTSGTFTWDGTTDNGQKAPVGLYVFYFEIFNLKGEVKAYKTVGVVAAKL